MDEKDKFFISSVSLVSIPFMVLWTIIGVPSYLIVFTAIGGIILSTGVYKKLRN